jgi:hypothetical protein
MFFVTTPSNHLHKTKTSLQQIVIQEFKKSDPFMKVFVGKL